MGNKVLLLWVLVLFIETQQTSLRRRRVVDGYAASHAQFPYVASLQSTDDMVWFCSAIIINVRWILTAGHCILEDDGNKESFEVIVGSHRIYAGEKYKVNQTYVHPKYKLTKPHIYNDIALIRLASPLTLSPTVQPIPLGLPTKNEEEVTAVGWGQVNPYAVIRSAFLQAIDLKVLDTEKCQKIHAAANNTINGTTQICVYSDVKGSPCSGDSGGPLVRVATGRLVGVFSGFEDCAGKYPTVFTKVATFVPWIKNVTEIEFPLG